MVNKHLVLMESGGFFYVLFFLSVLSLLGISTSSSQKQNIYCNATIHCRINVSAMSNFSVCCDNICRLRADCRLNSSSHTNSSSSNPNNFIKDSSENTGNSSNMIGNNTRSDHTGQSNTTVNQSLSCFKDSDCISPKICISLDCLTNSPNDKIQDCKSCESSDCKDGSCYNMTSTVLPTETTTKGSITTLQLVLLFGSMGGIFIFIVIVYCVKTFTDNRQRQYLLKHGVWENPPNKDGKEKGDVDAKSDASRQQRKLEVPTITVETETDSKRKRKNKENSKDEVTDTEGLEEFAVQQDSKNQKVTETDQGSLNVKLEANHCTKNPYCAKTKIGQTIESTKNIRMPTGWDNKDENTPLTESPKQNRFGNLRKTKDRSPTKIIANGTPEKSSRFGKQKQNSTSVQLCEPENFSDFGM